MYVQSISCKGVMSTQFLSHTDELLMYIFFMGKMTVCIPDLKGQIHLQSGNVWPLP